MHLLGRRASSVLVWLQAPLHPSATVLDCCPFHLSCLQSSLPELSCSSAFRELAPQDPGLPTGHLHLSMLVPPPWSPFFSSPSLGPAALFSGFLSCVSHTVNVRRGFLFSVSLQLVLLRAGNQTFFSSSHCFHQPECN